jgi:hypothetical protein
VSDLEILFLMAIASFLPWFLILVDMKNIYIFSTQTIVTIWILCVVTDVILSGYLP